jgi:hypothetical protein
MPPSDRLEALMTAALDVRAGEPVRDMADASDEHRARFERYVRELRRAKRVAEEWWSGLVEGETDRVGSEAQAQINVRIRRPPGPVVNPTVVHVIRRAWLDCQRINDTLPESSRVAPAAFVLLWLEQAGKHDLGRFVAGIPYWPLGLDDSGRWI